MSYTRVIPRDLFNEAKLLKCLGQLSLLIHDGAKIPRGLTLSHDDSEFPGFQIEQNDHDGALYCTNLELTYRGRLIGLCSPYNCKDVYPLRFAIALDMRGDEILEGHVFTDAGELSEEFRAMLAQIGA